MVNQGVVILSSIFHPPFLRRLDWKGGYHVDGDVPTSTGIHFHASYRYWSKARVIHEYRTVFGG